MNKFTSTWAVVVSVIILLALKVYNPIPLQTLQLKTFDLYQKFGDNYKSKSLVLIDISDNSLNYLVCLYYGDCGTVRASDY